MNNFNTLNFNSRQAVLPMLIAVSLRTAISAKCFARFLGALPANTAGKGDNRDSPHCHLFRCFNGNSLSYFPGRESRKQNRRKVCYYREAAVAEPPAADLSGGAAQGKQYGATLWI